MHVDNYPAGSEDGTDQEFSLYRVLLGEFGVGSDNALFHLLSHPLHLLARCLALQMEDVLLLLRQRLEEMLLSEQTQ